MKLRILHYIGKEIMKNPPCLGISTCPVDKFRITKGAQLRFVGNLFFPAFMLNQRTNAIFQQRFHQCCIALIRSFAHPCAGQSPSKTQLFRPQLLIHSEQLHHQRNQFLIRSREHLCMPHAHFRRAHNKRLCILGLHAFQHHLKKLFFASL